MNKDKKWQIKEQAPEEFGKEFPEFSSLTRNLLWQRGLKTQKDIDEFFNPDYSTDLHAPLLLKDAQKAVDRIFEALEKKEKVVVYGDYDSDGVCGATIMHNALQDIGFTRHNLGIYMPDREKEGYGLHEGAVEQFIKEKYNLIITIDCGTTSHKPISRANKNSLDVIVIDHHRVIDSPPPAYAFVNPHQEDDEYPFKDLCGAAVAFKVACALYQKADINEGREKWFLDLVAMATITDIMPLLGENRTLVKYGLFVLAQAERPGLRALMEVSGIKPVFNQDSLTTNLKPWTLGFMLGPRLNAAGRIDHANTAFALLNADRYEEALKFAKEIDERNRERQGLARAVSGLFPVFM
ncbi:MAG: DHH family phosphoesterase [Candidatus Spechtbacteria bacterium]|nr:DHH family phosphoesterase [Candidatus Spechtbacteria bacterium]